MNRTVKLAALLACLCALFAGTKGYCGTKAAQYHIGVITGDAQASKDEFLGAEDLREEYGDAQKGGMVAHITYKGDLKRDGGAGIASVAALADDPLMKAILIDRAVSGTSEAFRQVRAKRPDILLFAGEPDEDLLTIQSAADLVVSTDFISRGYTIPWAAKQLGVKNFLHISYPRHLGYEVLSRERAIMEQACKDLGLDFYSETCLDPASSAGVSGAQQYILEKTRQWIQKYGKDTAFFCTDDTLAEPLIKQLIKYGGIFVEAALPSPLVGYPGALGLDMPKDVGNFPPILKKLEGAVNAKGGAGRFGTWTFSDGYALTAGLGQHAIDTIEGRTKVDDMNAVLKALEKYSPGAKWSGSYYIDQATGVRAKNQVLVFVDTYIFGKGFLPTTQQKIDPKYFQIQAQK